LPEIGIGAVEEDDLSRLCGRCGLGVTGAMDRTVEQKKRRIAAEDFIKSVYTARGESVVDERVCAHCS
jgi:hypothetical protein